MRFFYATYIACPLRFRHSFGGWGSARRQLAEKEKLQKHREKQALRATQLRQRREGQKVRQQLRQQQAEKVQQTQALRELCALSKMNNDVEWDPLTLKPLSKFLSGKWGEELRARACRRLGRRPHQNVEYVLCTAASLQQAGCAGGGLTM